MAAERNYVWNDGVPLELKSLQDAETQKKTILST